VGWLAAERPAVAAGPAALLAERHATGTVRIRAAGGDWMRLSYNLRPFDSMLSEVADPRRAPELLALRERIRSALQDGSARTIKLIKDDGRTLIDGQGTLHEPAWHWPGR
jgi:hypothetical protein